jgi:hypothetical protein
MLCRPSRMTYSHGVDVSIGRLPIRHLDGCDSKGPNVRLRDGVTMAVEPHTCHTHAHTPHHETGPRRSTVQDTTHNTHGACEGRPVKAHPHVLTTKSERETAACTITQPVTSAECGNTRGKSSSRMRSMGEWWGRAGASKSQHSDMDTDLSVVVGLLDNLGGHPEWCSDQGVPLGHGVVQLGTHTKVRCAHERDTGCAGG